MTDGQGPGRPPRIGARVAALGLLAGLIVTLSTGAALATGMLKQLHEILPPGKVALDVPVVPPKPGTRPLMGMRPSFLTSNSRADQTGSIDHVPAGICVTGVSARIVIANSFVFATIEYASNYSA